jgi:hypothetical protein
MIQFGGDKETILETGHTLMHCMHGLEYCCRSPRDYTDMNREARRDSEAELRKRQLKASSASVNAAGCAHGSCPGGVSMDKLLKCAGCRKVLSCSFLAPSTSLLTPLCECLELMQSIRSLANEVLPVM